MTIIVATPTSIIADRRITSNTLIYDGGSKLVHFKRGKKECVVGTAGNAVSGLLFLDWFSNNWFRWVNEREYNKIPFESKENGDAFTALCLYNNGNIGEFYNAFRELQVMTPIHAHGIARDFALGAYYTKNDIVKAAKIAIKLCSECGNGLDLFNLERPNGTFSSKFIDT